MKKRYIQPSCKQTNAKLQHIIAVSIGYDSTATPVDPANADAKDFSFEEWDFDWDE